FVDVGLVAEPDDGGDAHASGTAEPDDGHADTAGLRREGRAAFDRVWRAESRAEIFVRVVEAVDVGAHEPDAMLAGNRDKLLFEFDVTGFSEARRDEDRARHALLATFGQWA